MLRGVSCLAVFVAGLLALMLATDGFRVITTEGARRLSVASSPRPLPKTTFTDHEGRTFGWADLVSEPVLVEFIFTTCPDVCQKMTSDFATLNTGDAAFRLLSISFDQERDTVEQLARVAIHHGADGDRWRFARVDDPEALARLLDRFGVVVVPSPRQRFEHNTAIHGVDREGRLARIVDISELEAIQAWARDESG